MTTLLLPKSPVESAPGFPSPVTASNQIFPGKPLLTDEALGWLAYLDAKTAFNSTWFKDDAIHPSWDNYTGAPIGVYHRYDLSYATWALGLMAENTPAWRERYSKILGYMADRFLEYWAMWDWIENSGPDPNRANYPAEAAVLFPPGYMGKYDIPGWAGNGIEPFEYDPDPVRGNGSCNLMYKGYLNLVLGFYNYVSGDAKYDAPFTVRYSEDKTFTYDHRSLNELIANQLRTNISGLGCEVMKVYPWCNNLTGLGMRLFDIMHGTDLTSAYEGYKRYQRENFMGNGTGTGPIDWLSLYWDPTLPFNMKNEEHQFAYNWWANVWNGLPLDPQLFERLYEGAKRRFFTPQEDGSAYSIGLPGLDGDYQYATICAASAAKEIGDNEAFEAFNLWIQNNYQPTWDANSGAFYFHLGLNEEWPRGQLNDWLMPAYTITQPGQWRKLFREPNTAKFYQPTLTGVDYPALFVRQAFAEDDSLYAAFTSTDATRAGSATTVTVTNLVPGARYQTIVDGKSRGETVSDAGDLTVDLTIGTHTLLVRRAG